MNWRRQNVLSIVALVVLVALNTLLPAPDAALKAAPAVVAANQR